ncbi:calcium-translocating P-type ATPase, PMCA-type [Tepidibacter formicigenes]|jgi:calcium-translocating P-type ATPase|uniref:P-type Ca(2+) transporter n=1 Tax=Tepidibacter formicigenes DSM 15518 TaxID=1123349 RepID=A0A1M6U224_9FIRM|nr:calcium-translocating P-type ATPase, PMCA-type [Tepidibacter formicigenes]SHK63315.1 plasma-membrane calcium-translocating P-type ATPase [Tepidibacter formicigenes DSM 15518]
MKNDIKGLDEQAVEESRKQYGSNKLTEQEVEGFWDKLKENFEDPIIKILILALVMNVIFFFLGKTEWYESLGIAFAVFIATFVATWSEHSNEVSFQKLQEDASKIKCKVYRNSKIDEILIDDIVVGDFVLLQSGDKIPADGILIEGTLQVDQSVLNGESKEAEKKAIPKDYKYNNEESVDFLDAYKVFRGTVISSGEAILQVKTVGDNTFYGKLAQELQTEERDSPLKVKLGHLADGISKFGYIGGSLIALSFMFKKIVIDNGYNIGSILSYASDWTNVVNDLVTAVILAIIIIVVAVPEGLPMMIAMVLSLNMKKLLDDNILVRKLIGIETSGSLNILFSDKTGTITKGQLEVVTFVDGENKSYSTFNEITGELNKLLDLSITQNTNAVVAECDETGWYQIIGGNATERAVLGFINNFSKNKFNIEKVYSIPFSSEKKFSATQVKGEYNLTLLKGAPEKILEKCNYYYDKNGNRKKLINKNTLEDTIDNLASRSIRVIAVATTHENLEEDKNLEDLTLVGIMGIRDDLREESKEAIKEVQEAGIQVVMITGDRKETAVAIAKESGLLRYEDEIVLTSSEIQKLSDEDLKKMLPKIRVIARALPTDKSRLVKIAQELDLVVGMTGDGVNDSPALKKADVGFAMGSGTEVAKEAGDIVVLDDNFFSISKAVLYGRTIYHSIRKFITYQLTVNVAAILIAFLGPFIGINLPLSMTQMLWVNLVMDTLAALAFGGEVALRKYMQEVPKKRTESIISKDMWSSILINGVFIAGISVFFLKSFYIREVFRTGLEGNEDIYFLTGFFAFFIFLNAFNTFNARTNELNLFDHILENKGFLKVVGIIFAVQVVFTYIGGEVLRTAGLTLSEWLYVISLSILIIPVDLIRKFIRDFVLKEKVEDGL